VDLTETRGVTSQKFFFFKTFIMHSFLDEKLGGDCGKSFHSVLPFFYSNFGVIPRIESEVPH
jgi:hypothetical protein